MTKCVKFNNFALSVLLTAQEMWIDLPTEITREFYSVFVATFVQANLFR